MRNCCVPVLFEHPLLNWSRSSTVRPSPVLTGVAPCCSCHDGCLTLLARSFPQKLPYDMSVVNFLADGKIPFWPSRLNQSHVFCPLCRSVPILNRSTSCQTSRFSKSKMEKEEPLEALGCGVFTPRWLLRLLSYSGVNTSALSPTTMACEAPCNLETSHPVVYCAMHFSASASSITNDLRDQNLRVHPTKDRCDRAYDAV